MGAVLPVLTYNYSEKSFDFAVKTPPAAKFVALRPQSKKLVPRANRLRRLGSVYGNQ